MKERIQTLLEDKLKNSSYFLVELNYWPENRQIEALIDGDEGIDVDKCSELTRFLSREIENMEVGDKGLSITVSSPGLDKPLIKRRQFNKNVGRKLFVSTNDGSQLEGKLAFLDEEKIILKGKKVGLNGREIAFSDIAEAKVKI